MSVLDTILTKLQRLSAEDQQKVLDAIEKLPAVAPASQEHGPVDTECSQGESIWVKLKEIAKQSENAPCALPRDLAANHDHYLHQLPRRS
jgi:hypothetical protein